MTKNWIVINVVLLTVASLLGWQVYRSVQEFKSRNDPAAIAPTEDLKKRITAETTLPPAPPRAAYNPGEFAAIPDKNLFAESRSGEERVADTQVAEVPALSVKPVLVGVILSGSENLALVVDPTSQDARRRAQTKRLGDSFQGYTITEIAPTRMVLEYAGRREIIPLYDGSRRSAQGGKTPVIATRVVNFGGGGTSGAATGIRPAVTEAGRAVVTNPSARSVTRTAQPAGTPVVQTNPEPGARPAEGQESQGQRMIRTPFGEFPEPAPQATSPTELRDAQGRRIIRTPFGDIVRPEPPAKPPNQQQP
ncbi:MAG: hypothetical protein FJW35_10535 [Acidobacteria bacterium]|nr:hypothetical protein [Acidobacteriota bacterium]